MKRIVLSLLLLWIGGLSAFAQAPQALNYQAIARDNTGLPLSSQQISLQITILAGGVNGTPVYSETHTATTSSEGLFHLQIGRGAASLNQFADIDWGVDSHFAQVELDPSGGSNYQLLGTSELLSVPYALYAEHIGAENGVGAGGESQVSSLDNGFAEVVLIPLSVDAFQAVIDSSGYVFVAGSFQGSAQVGTTTITGEPNGFRDIFVAKFDWQGNLMWVKSGGAPQDDDQPKALIASGGELLLAGYFGYSFNPQLSLVDFGGSTFPNAAHNDFVMKFDQAGNIEWINLGGAKSSLGFADYTSIAWKPGIGIGIGGRFSGTLSLGSFNLTANPMGPDGFIGMLDENNGTYSWIDTFGVDFYDEGGFGLNFSSQNQLYAAYSRYDLDLFRPDSSRWCVFNSSGTLVTQKMVSHQLWPPIPGDSMFYSLWDNHEGARDQLYTIDPSSLSITGSAQIIGSNRFDLASPTSLNDLLVMNRSGSNYIVEGVMYHPVSIAEPFLLEFDASAQLSLSRRFKIFATGSQGLRPLSIQSDGTDTRLLGQISGYFYNTGQLYTDGLYLLRW